jgi:hypothetical protein
MVIIEKLLESIKSLTLNAPNISGLINLSTTNYNWLFGALGTIVLSLYGLSVGRTKAIFSLLSIYVALAINLTFPYFNQLQDFVGGGFQIHWIKVGVFLVAYILVFSIISFSFVYRRISSSEFSLSGILVISLLQLGLILSIVANLLPSSLVENLSLGFYQYLGTNTALFLWLVAPIPVLLFLRSK